MKKNFLMVLVALMISFPGIVSAEDGTLLPKGAWLSYMSGSYNYNSNISANRSIMYAGHIYEQGSAAGKTIKRHIIYLRDQDGGIVEIRFSLKEVFFIGGEAVAVVGIVLDSYGVSSAVLESRY